MCALPKLPVVAQYCRTYLSLTEGFIYSVIAGVRRVRSQVLCHRLTEYQHLFPLPPGSISQLTGTRYSLRWMADAIQSRLHDEGEMDRIVAARMASVSGSDEFRLIHAHFGPMGAAALVARKRLGIPLVTNFYGSDTAPETHDPRWPGQRAELFQKGDLFLVEGLHMKARLVDLGCAENKICIQRISLRLDQLPVRNPRPDGTRTPVLLFAGRFVEKKGLIYALQAAAEVRRGGYAFEFRIIGDGPLAAECRAFVAEHGLEENVRFLGLLERPAYLEELAGADIFVSPSVTAANGDTEGGAPTTILEAQALGLPVLATTHADIPNVTVPGASAILAPERDSAALAAALAKLLDERSSWDRMGQAGREFVAMHHDVSREVARLEDRYLSLMGR